jgi:hypothetical protein
VRGAGTLPPPDVTALPSHANAAIAVVFAVVYLGMFLGGLPRLKRFSTSRCIAGS